MVRLIPSLLLIICLAGCHRGEQNSDAVRQGVIDHLAKGGFNVSAMDVKVASVKFNGEQADADITVAPKGQTSGPPMSLRYHMEHQNDKWVVVNLAKETGHGAGVADPNAGANPHGGAMTPDAVGGDNPHGGMAPAAGGAGKMPSPQDLPPATKK